MSSRLCKLCKKAALFHKGGGKGGSWPSYCDPCRKEVARRQANEYRSKKYGYVPGRRKEKAQPGQFDLPARFWSKVNKTETCWLWTAAVCRGYGVFAEDKKLKKAHRVMYRQAVGPLDDNLVVDHLCRVTTCVRPEHLEAVTHKMNIMRGVGRAAENALKVFCGNGHRLTPENTQIKRTKGRVERVCRSCMRQYMRNFRMRKKMASQKG